MRILRLFLFLSLLVLLSGAQVLASAPQPAPLSAPSPLHITAPYVPSTADQMRDALRLKYRSAQHTYTPVTSRQAQAHTAAWTVLVYMAADNDLEPFAMGDINEMEFVGSTTDMNIIVQLDRSPNYNTSNGDWSDSRRLFITQDTSLTKIASEDVGDLGETNTGDPATLVNFTDWGIQTYPADHYALIIWDHGGSWYGVASDESSDYDDLSLPELTEALWQTVDQSHLEKLDMIGFDACLMGALEVYQAIAPYARYAIGSAELIPGNGWDYFGSLDALASDPTMKGDSFGRAVIDSFADFYTNVVTSYPLFSLGLVDLSQSANVAAALDEFTTQVSVQPDVAVNVIGSARRDTHVFGAFDDPQFTDVWAATDLLQFMELVASDSSDPSLQEAANNAHVAGDNMMLYYKSSEALLGSGGLSIYFPRSSNNFYENNRGNKYTQEVPSALSLWPQFLDQFYNLAAQLTADGFQNTLLGVSASGSQAAVSVDAVKSSLVDSSVLILLDIGRGQRIIIDYQRLNGENTDDTALTDPKSDIHARQDKGSQTVFWAATVPYLTDGTARLPILLLPSRYNANTAVINGVFYPQDGPPVNAQLVIDLITNQVISVWGIRNVDGTPMSAEIMVQPGDLFLPTWFVLGPNNEITAMPATIKLVFSEEPLVITWLSAPPGAYTVVTQAQGVGGGAAIQDSTGVAVTESTPDQLVLFAVDPSNPDIDGDGILNENDNCPVLVNPQQEDADGDSIGDVCDLFDNQDLDQDGVLSTNDNCPTVANPDQQDSNGDGVGDLCQPANDQDQDGIMDTLDNCPTVYNQYQSDADADGVGDACDTPPTAVPNLDRDDDGVVDSRDNCPDTPNADQSDSDQDGLGDACESVPDSDGDGLPDNVDNCPSISNTDQKDSNSNGQGDACEVASPPPTSPTSTETPTAPIYDIAVSISAPGSVPLGSPLSYTITVQNVGNQTVNNILISHPISPDLYSPSYSVSQGSYDGFGSDYIWDVGTLTAGASATLPVNGSTSSMDVTITASLYSASADTNSANDAASQTVTLAPIVVAGDIAISVSAPATVEAGANLTYTITVTNVGSTDITSWDVSYTVPAELANPVSSTSVGIPVLSAGSSTSFNVVGTVTASAGDTLTLSASLTSSTPADANSSNNTASASVTVTAPPSGDLSISIVYYSGLVSSGNPITYTIYVSNVGSTTMNSIIISHLLPSMGVVGLTGSPSTGTWDGVSQWSIPSLGPGDGVATLQMNGYTNAAPPPSISLSAGLSFSSPSDNNVSNNNGSTSISVYIP